MSIIDDIKNKGITVEKGTREGVYDILLSRPSKCVCGGHATKIGQQAPRTVLDLEGSDTLTYRHLTYTRYRCNKCRQYLLSPDMAVLESIAPKKKLCTDAATVFLIRQLLANPDCNYMVIAKKYSISAGVLCNAFRQFYEEIYRKLSAILPCNQFILYPYTHRRKKMICVFGTDDKGRIGIIDIIQKEDAKDFLIWISRARTLDIGGIVCSFDFLGADELDLYSHTAILNSDLDKYAKFIAERMGDSFVAKIHAVANIAIPEEYEKQLDKLCGTISHKHRSRCDMFADDVKDYAYWYRNRAVYDADYIQSAIELIKTLKTRKYTDEQIVLCAMFSSPMHRDALLNTEYAKYIID